MTLSESYSIVLCGAFLFQAKIMYLKYIWIWIRVIKISIDIGPVLYNPLPLLFISSIGCLNKIHYYYVDNKKIIIIKLWIFLLLKNMNALLFLFIFIYYLFIYLKIIFNYHRSNPGPTPVEPLNLELLPTPVQRSVRFWLPCSNVMGPTSNNWGNSRYSSSSQEKRDANI
jgi:hypothetical protein